MPQSKVQQSHDGDASPSPEVRATLRSILLTSDVARAKEDYEFLDKYVHSVHYFADVPPRDRLKYLKAARGVELEPGDTLFYHGDHADALYCVMYGSVNVVVDLAHMGATTMNEFDEIINRARIHSSLFNPGGTLETTQAASYVVRSLPMLECFGETGLLASDQLRTASVVANERTLLMKLSQSVFMDLRRSNAARELRAKVRFLSSMADFEHWAMDAKIRLAGKLEILRGSYNDVLVTQGDNATHFYLVVHGECRLVRRYESLGKHSEPCVVELCTVGSGQGVGALEILTGAAVAACSMLVSSPSAVLYRIDRVDFRQIALKDQRTDQAMRSGAEALAALMDERSVRQELQADRAWRQYRRDLVASVCTRHALSHATPMGQRKHDFGGGERDARQSLVHMSSNRSWDGVARDGTSPITSPRNQRRLQSPAALSSVTLAPCDRRPAPGLSPRTARLKSGHHQPQQQHWLEWAQQRTQTQDGGLKPTTPRNQSASNIQWSKTSRIMGGLQDPGQADKITSAIVALFNSGDR